MAAKKLLTATFKYPTHPRTRTTDIDYTHAWLVWGHNSKGVKYVRHGFSTSATKAARAAKTELSYMTHNPSGTEIVEVVATEPAKKVNPAKGKPWRIVSTSASGPQSIGGRFVTSGRGEHLRFATETEAQTKADELARESAERHAKNSNFVACTYTPHKGALPK